MQTKVGRPGDPATRRPGDPATIILSEPSAAFVNPRDEDGFPVSRRRPAMAAQTPDQTRFATPTMTPPQTL